MSSASVFDGLIKNLKQQSESAKRSKPVNTDQPDPLAHLINKL